MEGSWITEVIHGAKFEFWVYKIFWERKKTLVTCRVEKEKMVKTSEDHNFPLRTQN
jgi:hypothetical protein